MQFFTALTVCYLINLIVHVENSLFKKVGSIFSKGRCAKEQDGSRGGSAENFGAFFKHFEPFQWVSKPKFSKGRLRRRFQREPSAPATFT